MKKSTVFFLFSFCLLLILSACTRSSSSLSVSGKESGVAGDIITLTASADGVGWSSSDETLATVDAAGRVSLLSPGTVVITARLSSEAATITITITATSAFVIEGGEPLSEGDTLLLTATTTKALAWSSSDETVATVANGLVTALHAGSTTITAVDADGTSASLVLTVTIRALQGSLEVFAGRTWTYTLPGLHVKTWSLSNTSDATISSTGVLTIYKDEAFSLTISAIDDADVVHPLTVSVLDKVPSYDDSLYYVDSSLESHLLRDVITIDGYAYYYGYTAFYTIASCLAKVPDGATIKVAHGEYDLSDAAGDLNVKHSDLTIIGPNAGRKSGEDRLPEALVYQNVNLYSHVTGTTIDGFQFFGSAYINLVGLNSGTTIASCLFDKGYGSSSLVSGLTYGKGTIRFNYTTTSVTDGFVVKDNTFSNLKDVAITLGNAINVTITGNAFSSLASHAIYVNPLLYNNEHEVLITSNSFTDIAGSAIKTASFGLTSSNEKDLLLIQANVFTRIGTDGTSALLDIAKYDSGASALSFTNNLVSETDRGIDASFALGVNDVDVVIAMNYNVFLGIPSAYYLKTSLGDACDATLNHYADAAGNALLASASLTEKGADITNAATRAACEAAPVIALAPLALEGETDLSFASGITASALNASVASLQGNAIVLSSLGKARFTVTLDGKTGFFTLFVRQYLGTDYIKLFVEMALSQEGYVEGPNNDTKYGTWYGMPNQAWCAMFVAWCANQVGVPLTVIPSYCAVRDYESWYRSAGRFGVKGSYIPTAGDLIIFTSDGASHIGIVTYCDGTTVYTIEGNTSDMCAERSYSLSNARITGYGRPNWPEFLGKAYKYYPDGVKPDEDHSTT